MESGATPDSRKQRRQERADEYLKHDLSGQREWYDRRASRHKTYANWLGLAVIGCGALTIFVISLKPSSFDIYDAIVAALGVAVALIQGVLRIWRYDESWIEYRLASERMLRERRLFINAAGPYADMADEDESLRYFIEAVEQIVAEEQKIYFKQDNAGPRQASAVQQDATTPPAAS